MSILGNIFSKIFPISHTAPSTATVAPLPQDTTAAPAPEVATNSTPITEVDVEKVLTDLEQKSSEKLNWRTSIVDLMKLLNIDSSLSARKDLAKELNYTGDMNDSASMNIWLHRQVMNKVAANGGKVPADLKD
jgi:hypothetical protein